MFELLSELQKQNKNKNKKQRGRRKILLNYFYFFSYKVLVNSYINFLSPLGIKTQHYSL